MPTMATNAIRRYNGYGQDAYTYIPIVVIGAGASGIAMGCRLKQELGFDQFAIFERMSGLGGTWWINRYPGVACDIPAPFYSFSFAQNPQWTSFFPSGREIVGYLEDVCAKFQITDKIQCNTSIEECRWLEEERLWEVRLRHLVPGVGDLSTNDRLRLLKEKGPQSVYLSEETVRAKVVVSAAGALVEPKGLPEHIRGKEDFQGSIFHSARWDYNVDLKDKDVVVVGTGCSALQFVPKLVNDYGVKSVTQLMRSPHWVAPQPVPPGGKEAWSRHAAKVFTAVPPLLSLLRLFVAATTEYDWRLFGSGKYAEKERNKYETMMLERLEKVAPKKYHSILKPNYSAGCKRRIFDDTWYPMLHDPKMELTTAALTEVHDIKAVLRENGGGHDTVKDIPADVIILATGYEATKWLHPLKVKGKEGKDLLEQMEERGGPQAYQGTAMDGFPNFFLVFGPNTATGHSSVLLASENMVNYSLKFIKKILHGDVTTVEVKRSAEIAYTADIQEQLKKTVFASGGCSSWYYSESGWNSTTLPYSQIWFGYRCMFPKWEDWEIQYTTQGARRRILRKTFQLLAFMLLLVGTYRVRQLGIGLRGLLVLLRQGRHRSRAWLKQLLERGSRAL